MPTRTLAIASVLQGLRLYRSTLARASVSVESDTQTLAIASVLQNHD
jgi:hypothetical protein